MASDAPKREIVPELCQFAIRASAAISERRKAMSWPRRRIKLEWSISQAEEPGPDMRPPGIRLK